jgi:phenylacetate-coenzyme A ligase PaaK-like adenylate-forming protein
MIDAWISKKIALPPGASLTREAIESYQLQALRRTLFHVKKNRRWHSEALAGIDPVRDMVSVRDLAKLPFTNGADLMAHGLDMVCVPASRVSRIVTLPTSGTTGEPKRVYFTEADQELMIDYNANGLQVMTSPGDLWLVLMPAERPGSVGDLIVTGLERIGCQAIAYGILPFDGSGDDKALELMAEQGVNCILATASAATRLAMRSVNTAGCSVDLDPSVIAGGERSEPDPQSPGSGHLHSESAMLSAIRRSMKSILLSAEYVSDESVKAIEDAWDCNVFEHYGMTEMGLGGAMACETHIGYHPREADLIFEIIDPESGAVLPDGEYGEIVFTTLTREAMPFIRYRTGDFSRFIPEPCPCGSQLKCLARVADRNSAKGY